MDLNGIFVIAKRFKSKPRSRQGSVNTAVDAVLPPTSLKNERIKFKTNNFHLTPQLQDNQSSECQIAMDLNTHKKKQLTSARFVHTHTQNSCIVPG